MRRSQRGLVILIAAMPLLLLVSTVLYMLGMDYLEGEPRGFWSSLEWAAETITTTGYGADARWRHPVMVLFAVGLQFLGVLLVFLIFPLYLIPFLEERFEARLPREVRDLADHVVIFRYGACVATLLEELGRAGVSAVLIEEGEEEARRLVEMGQRAIWRRLEDDALLAAGLERARALIANGRDDENSAVILSARQLGFSGEVLALVEDPYHRHPMMMTGATAVYTPRHLLAAALAARASQKISPTVAGIQQLGLKLEINDLRIRPESSVSGRTLAEAGIGERTGAIVIGQWIGGRLNAQPTASMRLEPGGVLIVAGRHESIERLGELVGGRAPLRRQGVFLVAGFGEVGAKVVELLKSVDEETQVIDRTEREGVDLVGNVLDLKVLERSSLNRAQAVVLALDSDEATLFAAVIIKDLAPEVPIIARVNQASNVETIHRAGADFALSLSQVSGQMLASRLLGEEAVSVDPRLKVLKVPAQHLPRRHPLQLGIREQTGCSVVAVERGEDVVVNFGPDFRLEPDDTLYICGSPDGLHRFGGMYPQSG